MSEKVSDCLLPECHKTLYVNLKENMLTGNGIEQVIRLFEENGSYNKWLKRHVRRKKSS